MRHYLAFYIGIKIILSFNIKLRTVHFTSLIQDMDQ